jgi:hypothetical protein
MQAQPVKNQRNTVAASLLHFTGLCTFCAMSVGCSPKGELEGVTGEYISGWVCDGDDYSATIQVQLYATNVSRGAFTQGGSPCPDDDRTLCLIGESDILAAGETFDTEGRFASTFYRENSKSSQCGGNHRIGFKIPTPGALLDGRDHKIVAYGINVGPGRTGFLAGSPVTYN